MVRASKVSLWRRYPEATVGKAPLDAFNSCVDQIGIRASQGCDLAGMSAKPTP
jgi:hypothetical protein